MGISAMLIEDFIDQSNQTTDLNSLVSLYGKSVGHLGFNKFIYSLCTSSPQLRLGKRPGLINHFPKSWMEHYVKNSYIDYDPIYHRSAGTRGAFSWRHIEQMALAKKEREIMDGRKQSGLEDGISTIIAGPMGELVGMSVATDQRETKMDKNTPSKVYALMNQFHLRFMDIASAPLRLPYVKLSLREKSVLVWASQGKSNNDIASILNISPKTVEFHFSSIFTKLQVNNRVLAILKAINLRLIAP